MPPLQDFDNDGTLDIVTANYGNDNISFLRGVGNGKFGPTMLNTFGLTYALASGDVNNDGIADIATAESAPGGLSIMIGMGDGTFEETLSTCFGSFFSRCCYCRYKQR
jgi:hypothetical protein